MRWRLATAALFTCLLATGCGGSRHGRRPERPRHQAVVVGTFVSTGGAFRWLIDTDGPQPTVAAENRHQARRTGDCLVRPPRSVESRTAT